VRARARSNRLTGDRNVEPGIVVGRDIGVICLEAVVENTDLYVGAGILNTEPVAPDL
jgi:hypothetical protein